MPRLTAQQLEFRRDKIGASDIVRIAGLIPFRGGTALDVWLEKEGLNDRQENEAMELGHEMEGVICRRYAKRTGLALVDGESQCHPEMRWAFATPDRLAPDEKRIVEAKNVGSRMAHFWDDDAPPVYVTAQMQWQLGIFVWAQSADVAALLGGSDFRIYQGIELDPEIWASLLAVGEQFYRDHMLTHVPPPVDGTESARDYLQKLYPRNYKPLVEAPPEAVTWARCLLEAKAQLEAAEDRKLLAENKLKQLIGEAEGIYGPFGRITWKAPKDKSVTDWLALSLELGATPEQIQKHTETKPQSRRFLPRLKEGF
jgi:putative phage-type endonuclease